MRSYLLNRLSRHAQHASAAPVRRHRRLSALARHQPPRPETHRGVWRRAHAPAACTASPFGLDNIMRAGRRGLHAKLGGEVKRRPELPIEVLAQIASQTQGEDLEALCVALSPAYGDDVRTSLLQFVAAPFQKSMRGFVQGYCEDFSQVVTFGLAAPVLQQLKPLEQQALLHIALPLGLDSPLVRQLRGSDHACFLQRFDTLTQLLMAFIEDGDSFDAYKRISSQLSLALQEFAVFCQCPPCFTEQQVVADSMLPVLARMRDAHLRASARDADELRQRLAQVHDAASLKTASYFVQALIDSIYASHELMIDMQRGRAGR